MRYAHVTKMAADPRITSLPRSHRALWRHVALKADEDGVWRRQISDRALAAFLEYEVSTLRKARRRLAEEKLLRYVAGAGRVRTIYAVPVVVGGTIAEPEYPVPAVAPGNGLRAGADTASQRTTSTPPTPADSVPASHPTQEPIPGIPRQSGHNDPAAAESLPGDPLLQNRATSRDVPRSRWCDDAKMAGEPHKNRRCCHTTPRELAKLDAARVKAERRQAEAAAAAERRASAVAASASADHVSGAAAARARIVSAEHNPRYKSAT